METIVPISDLQSKSKKLVEQVKKTGVPIVVTQRGRPAAMLVNYETWEGHFATLDEMSFPDWRARLERAHREIDSGKLVPHERAIRQTKRRR